MTSPIPNPRTGFLRTAAVLGFLAVAFGAFGAHALEDFLKESGRVETWQTAVFYHLTHSIMLVWLAGRSPQSSLALWAFAVGIVIFSGSLYLLCLTGIGIFGAITPLGGLSLLLGWGRLAWKPADSAA
jgi:uncharacterized membrane protein YgdD (TMEM256/DUF423 family)